MHDATGTSPYELVFGQKPQSILFPSGKCTQPVLEEDLERDGIQIEDQKHTIEMEEEYDEWKAEEEMVKRATEDVEDKEMNKEQMGIANEGEKEEKKELDGTNRDGEWKAKEEVKRETKEVENKEVTIERVELVENKAKKTKRDEEWKEESAKMSKQEDKESTCKRRRLAVSDPDKRMSLLATTQKHLQVCTN